MSAVINWTPEAARYLARMAVERSTSGVDLAHNAAAVFDDGLVYENAGSKWLRPLLDEVNRVYAKRLSVRVEHMPVGAHVVVSDGSGGPYAVSAFHADTSVAIEAVYQALRAMPGAEAKKP